MFITINNVKMNSDKNIFTSNRYVLELYCLNIKMYRNETI